MVFGGSASSAYFYTEGMVYFMMTDLNERSRRIMVGFGMFEQFWVKTDVEHHGESMLARLFDRIVDL